MARVLQLRKGSTQENEIFIGSEGELTYDVERKDLRTHDGIVAGGFNIPVVSQYKYPTIDDPRWCRKYSDGWVEQGGRVVVTLESLNTAATVACNFLVEMADTKYNFTITPKLDSLSNVAGGIESLSTSSMSGLVVTSGGTVPVDIEVCWEVKGRWE